MASTSIDLVFQKQNWQPFVYLVSEIQEGKDNKRIIKFQINRVAVRSKPVIFFSLRNKIQSLLKVNDDYRGVKNNWKRQKFLSRLDYNTWHYRKNNN